MVISPVFLGKLVWKFDFLYKWSEGVALLIRKWSFHLRVSVCIILRRVGSVFGLCFVNVKNVCNGHHAALTTRRKLFEKKSKSNNITHLESVPAGFGPWPSQTWSRHASDYSPKLELSLKLIIHSRLSCPSKLSKVPRFI